VDVAQADAAEEIDLVAHGEGVLALGVAGGEDVVPEESHLFFERARAVDHAVDPGTGADLRPFTAKVALDDILVDRRAALLVHQIFYDFVVAFCGVGLELFAAGAEACPAQQMSHQAQILICHIYLLTAVVSGQWSVATRVSVCDISAAGERIPFR